MTKTLYILILLLSLMPLSLHASEDAERTRHYAFETPTDKASALELYYTNLGIIMHHLASKEARHTQLEAVHERSYALEEAVDYLKNTGYDAASMEILAHDIEELHEYSEEHKAALTKEYLARVQRADDFLLR